MAFVSTVISCHNFHNFTCDFIKMLTPSLSERRLCRTLELEGRATSDPWSQTATLEFHNGAHSSARISQVWRPTWNPTPIWPRQEAPLKPTFLVEILSNLLRCYLFRETVFACIPNETVRLKEIAENSPKSMLNEIQVLGG